MNKNNNSKNILNNIKINKNFDSEFISLAENKIKSLQEVIKNTIVSVQKYKTINILGPSDLNISIKRLEKIQTKL